MLTQQGYLVDKIARAGIGNAKYIGGNRIRVWVPGYDIDDVVEATTEAVDAYIAEVTGKK